MEIANNINNLSCIHEIPLSIQILITGKVNVTPLYLDLSPIQSIQHMTTAKLSQGHFSAI